jgi:hypothetical protein
VGYIVVRTVLGVPIAGSIPLFMVGVVIYLSLQPSHAGRAQEEQRRPEAV